MPLGYKRRYILVLRILAKTCGIPQRVIEYIAKMISAQISAVYIVGIVRLIRPVKTLA